MTFNHFKVRRAAHALSRQSSGLSIQWGRKAQRRGTFPQDPEAQQQMDADKDDEISPITQTTSAPAPEFGEALYDEPEDRSPADLEKASNHAEGSGSNGAPNGGSKSLAPAGDGIRQRNKDIPNAQQAVDREGADKNGKDKPKKQGLIKHVQPKEPFTVANQIQRVFLSSWLNVLLVAAPVGIALGAIKVTPVAVFVCNFVAIIPLAAMLGFATEEIALRVGETLGGLLNATFGNAVELIVAIIALIDHQVVIVQTSLIGSILSNLLLVMGMCFFFGGINRKEQFFNTTVAQTAASLLALAVAGVIVPTVFDVASNTPVGEVASLSRGTAIILLFVYIAYLFFQLKTHSAMFNEESQKVEAKPFRKSLHQGAVKQGLARPAGLMAVTHGIHGHEQNEQLSKMLRASPDPEEEEEEEPQLHFFVAIAVLCGVTCLIGVCAEYLVDSIDVVTAQGGMSKEFLGLILLPIVGNAAEHATAVTVAIKDKMDLAIGVAIGSSMQIALFVIPLLVVIGWGMHEDAMSLSFDVFQVAVLFVAVLLVNYLIADGKSHWLEGMLLMCLYAIIAVCSWWYPPHEGGEGEAPQ